MMCLRIVWLSVFLFNYSVVVAQLPESHPKVLQTKEVIRRLATAFGINSNQLPKLVMYRSKKPGEGRIAYLEMKQNTLAVDEALFDICARISPENYSALAFVIGHELAHLNLGHSAHLSFAEKPTGSKNIVQISVQQEEKADITGLQYAYLAGYDPEPKLEALFSELYKHYNLDDTTPGYPSKKERIAQTKLTAPQFRHEALLFAVGQVLYCRRRYPEATQCFEKTAKRSTKEIYNNLGLCYLQQAIALKKDDVTAYFVLPLEFDPHNRLLLMDERGEDPQQMLWKNYLKQAQDAFKEALDLAPNYSVALLNRAIGAVLEKNYYKALGFLQEQQAASTQRLSGSAATIRAIAFCGLKMWSEAERDFAAARKLNAFQSIHNQSVFLQIKADPTLKKVRAAWKTLQRAPDNAIGCDPGRQLFEAPKDVDAAYIVPKKIELLQEINPKLTVYASPDYQTIQVITRNENLMLLRKLPRHR